MNGTHVKYISKPEKKGGAIFVKQRCFRASNSKKKVFSPATQPLSHQFTNQQEHWGPRPWDPTAARPSRQGFCWKCSVDEVAPSPKDPRGVGS